MDEGVEECGEIVREALGWLRVAGKDFFFELWRGFEHNDCSRTLIRRSKFFCTFCFLSL